MHTRCPHCHNHIEIVEDDSLKQIECPSCGSSFNLLSGDETVLGTVAEAGEESFTTSKIAHFELYERIGIGHFGAVWRAHDTKLDRPVAVKIPRREQLDDADAEKFFREARAAAQLNHPNIVSMHEVGREGETIYLVSDLIDGTDLKTRLVRMPFTFQESAELCVTIAEALEHAHQMGIVHRDLKPGNILLDRSGQPHVTDFGLAKREAGEITMTVDGQVLGTPAYMSPEQAGGRAHEADRRADVYALGVVLYELLTGELPFRGEPQMLVVQILNDEPTSPSKLDARVPRDLETICLKCLEKSPGKRYQTAGEFAAELKRYLSKEPIHARPISRTERYWRWCKRNPIVATLAAGVMLSLSIGLAFSTYFGFEAKREANDAIIARTQADKSRDNAYALATKNRQLADQERQARDEEAAARREATRLAESNAVLAEQEKGSRLKAQEQEQAAKQLADEKAKLATQEQQARMKADEETKRAETLAAKNARLAEQEKKERQRAEKQEQKATKLADEKAKLAAEEQKARKNAEEQTKRANELANKNADLADAERTARRQAEEQTKIARNLASRNAKLAESERRARQQADEQRILAERRFKTAQRATYNLQLAQVDGLWNSKPAKARDLLEDVERCPLHLREFAWRYYYELLSRNRTIQVSDRNIHTIDFSPDGSLLATGGGEKVIKLWDPRTGQLITDLKGHAGYIWCLRFSPDSKTLAASASQSGGKFELFLWDVAKRSVRTRFPDVESPGLCLGFAPDGRTIATGGKEGLTLWDVEGGTKRTTWSDPARPVYSLDYSPDGRMLAVGVAAGRGGSVRLISAETGRTQRALEGYRRNVTAVRFSPDGSRLAAVGGDPGIHIWNVSSGQIESILRGHANQVSSVAFSSDGSTLVSGSSAGWLNRTTTMRRRVRGIGTLNIPFMIPHAPPPGEVRVWDVSTGRLLSTDRRHVGDVRTVAMSPQDFLIASGGEDGTVRITANHEARTWSASLAADDPQGAVRISPDRRWVARGNGDVTIWDSVTRSIAQRLSRPNERLFFVDFSPDGTRLASASNSHIHIWNVATGMRESTLDLPRELRRSVLQIEFSPDGRTLVCIARTLSGENFSATVWNLEAGAVRNSFTLASDARGRFGRLGGPRLFRFSPDGRLYIAKDSRKTVGVWDIETGRQHAVLKSADSEIQLVAFSPKGSTVAIVTYQRVKTGDGRAKNRLIIQQMDYYTGQTSVVPISHEGILRCVAYSADGNLIATGGRNSEARVWDAVTGELVAVCQGHTAPLTSLAFSPDGETLATTAGQEDRRDRVRFDLTAELRLWDPRTGQLRATLGGQTEIAHELMFSPDGERLLSIYRNGSVTAWSASAGSNFTALLKHTAPVSYAKFSYDGEGLATTDLDGYVCLWDIRTGDLQRTLKTRLEEPTPKQRGSGLSALKPRGFPLFQIDGKLSRVASVHSRSIQLWDVANGRETVQFDLQGFQRATLTTPFAIAADARLFACPAKHGAVKIWDGADESVLQATDNLDEMPPITCLRFSPDGKLLATGGTKRHTSRIQGTTSKRSARKRQLVLQLWDTASGTLKQELYGHTRPLRSVAFSADASQVSAGDSAGNIYIWRLSDAQLLRTLANGTDRDVWRIEFAPDGRRLWSTSYYGVSNYADIKERRERRHWVQATLWDVTRETDAPLWEAGVPYLDSIAFARGGKLLAEATLDHKITLWNAETARPLHTFRGHKTWIRYLCTSPNGNTLVSTSDDHTARLWDLSDVPLIPNP